MSELNGTRPTGRARIQPVEVVSEVEGETEIAVRGLLVTLRAGRDWTPGDEVLAAQATRLARALDRGAGMATAAISRELRAIVSQLPHAPAPDGALDKLMSRRVARRTAIEFSDGGDRLS